MVTFDEWRRESGDDTCAAHSRGSARLPRARLWLRSRLRRRLGGGERCARPRRQRRGCGGCGRDRRVGERLHTLLERGDVLAGVGAGRLERFEVAEGLQVVPAAVVRLGTTEERLRRGGGEEAEGERAGERGTEAVVAAEGNGDGRGLREGDWGALAFGCSGVMLRTVVHSFTTSTNCCSMRKPAARLLWRATRSSVSPFGVRLSACERA